MDNKFSRVTFDELKDLKSVISCTTRYKIKSFKHPKLDERIYKLFRKDHEFWLYSNEDCEIYTSPIIVIANRKSKERNFVKFNVTIVNFTTHL